MKLLVSNQRPARSWNIQLIKPRAKHYHKFLRLIWAITNMAIIRSMFLTLKQPKNCWLATEISWRKLNVEMNFCYWGYQQKSRAITLEVGSCNRKTMEKVAIDPNIIANRIVKISWTPFDKTHERYQEIPEEYRMSYSTNVRTFKWFLLQRNESDY